MRDKKNQDTEGVCLSVSLVSLANKPVAGSDFGKSHGRKKVEKSRSPFASNIDGKRVRPFRFVFICGRHFLREIPAARRVNFSSTFWTSLLLAWEFAVCLFGVFIFPPFSFQSGAYPENNYGEGLA